MGKYTSKINTLKEALKDKSGLSESQIKELESGLKKFEEMEEAESKKAESKPAAKKKAPAKKKNKSHKKEAEPAKAPEKKKVKHKKVTEKRKKHIEKREEKKKNKSHKVEAPAKKKVVHKKASPKRAAAIAKRTEKKAAKHHKPAHHEEHKPEAAGKSIHHKIDSIIKDVESLKPEISRMAEHERKDAEEKMRTKLRHATSDIFESGGSVEGGGFDLFEDIIFMGSSSEKFGKGGSPKSPEKSHPHVRILKKGRRLPHGTQADKSVNKKKDYSSDAIHVDKGYHLHGGHELTHGAKPKKQYEGGGSPKKKGGNPNFKPSYGIFTDKAKAEAQAKAKNGIVEVLKAKTVPAHTKNKRNKSTGEMREVHHKERHYPVRYMVKSK